jgi:hypothetical protein
MTRGRGRRGGAVLLAAVIAALTWAATLVAPAQAGACPSTSASKLVFKGDGTISFSGSASGPDQAGGSESVKLDDTMFAQFGGVHAVAGTRGVDFYGSELYGSHVIDDTYIDVDSSGKRSSGTQTASTTLSTFAGIIFNSPTFQALGEACEYQVTIRVTLKTQTSGSGSAVEPPGRVSIYATSGLRPIPANLRLTGSATVDAYCSPPTGAFERALLEGGYYLDGGENAYEAAFCGARSSAGVGPGQPVGKAMIDWNFRPA